MRTKRREKNSTAERIVLFENFTTASYMGFDLVNLGILR
jgi:hypothetical protein